MTQEAPRCQVEEVWEVMTIGTGSVQQRRTVCGEPLVPTEGPCETCGMVVSLTALDGDSHLRAEGHPLERPLVCPIHSAAPDRGEA